MGTVGGMTQTALGDGLRHALAGRWPHIRDEARERLSPEDLAHASGLSTDEHRARIAEQMQLIVKTGHPHAGFARQHGGGGDPGASVTSFEMLANADLSLLVKAGVQWGLFGGAIENLGTERHHGLLPQVMDLTLPGCFAMTETGHGSDVQSLLTTATYDPDTDEFVVHTPNLQARKDYIGGAARDARMAVVFAQLETRGETHGVHALLVPIRDEDGRTRDGVTIEDCGWKAGLNGVDNGRLWFDQVRVPRGQPAGPVRQGRRRRHVLEPDRQRGQAILHHARHADPRPDLRRGRRGLGRPGGSGDRHPLRRAASPVQGAQRRGSGAARLPGAPAPAAAAAGPFVRAGVRAERDGVADARRADDRAAGEDADAHDQRELEARAAGLKALTTWHATRTIQECREACGGAGYLEENRLPQLKADTDVFTTFEGDNTVLLQLVAKELLVGTPRSSAASTPGGWCGSPPGRWREPWSSARPRAT